MTLPVRRRPGWPVERPIPTFGWGERVATESDELFERMNRLPESAASALAWSPAEDMRATTPM